MNATIVPRPPVPPRLAVQLARYGLVGATNTILSLATYTALVALGLPAVLAGAAGWGAGAANGYRLNRGWTFRSALRGASPVARYVAVALLGAGLNALGIAVAVGHDHLPRLAAEIAILPVVTVLTFALCRWWVFARAVRA